jgi:hypothetical protein
VASRGRCEERGGDVAVTQAGGSVSARGQARSWSGAGEESPRYGQGDGQRRSKGKVMMLQLAVKSMGFPRWSLRSSQG